ncbi:MAG: hypothetical protein ACOY5B_09645 [Spirochaetota bacterium]
MRRLSFFLLLSAFQAGIMAENVDFVELAGKAFPADGSINREYGDQLYAELYKLPEWHFLMTPASIRRKQPSVQVIDGKGWLLVFTDTGLLRKYAEQNKNLDAKGNALFVSMAPDKALQFLKQYEKSPIGGVRFNEGADHGWFSPVRNLFIFPDYLKKKGLL